MSLPSGLQPDPQPLSSTVQQMFFVVISAAVLSPPNSHGQWFRILMGPQRQSLDVYRSKGIRQVACV